MRTARVITENGHQVIQLPDELRIEGEVVTIKRVGRSLLLLPADSDPWLMLAESLEKFTDDYMRDRAQPAIQDRESLFE